MTADCSFARLFDFKDRDLPVVRIVVAATEGSAPRETGAAMIVGRFGSIGSIGGGQLEFQALSHARAMLEAPESAQPVWKRDMQVYPLGPKLAQCCGGMVRIFFERLGGEELLALKRSGPGATVTCQLNDSLVIRAVTTGSPALLCDRRHDARDFPLPIAGISSQMLRGQRKIEALLAGKPAQGPYYFIEPAAQSEPLLFIYGAGHVGRAIVKIAADLPFQINWVDTHDCRFPETWPDSVSRVVARDPTLIAHAAPRNAFHLVLTYSHALDFGICHTLLERPDFRFLGLIGSETKRARFMKRLNESGIAQGTLARLTCPIGIKKLKGKAPATIAVSVAAQLIEQLEGAPWAEQAVIGSTREQSEQLSA